MRAENHEARDLKLLGIIPKNANPRSANNGKKAIGNTKTGNLGILIEIFLFKNSLILFYNNKQTTKKQIVVISGVGVRGYYKKLGYGLEQTYMVKKM